MHLHLDGLDGAGYRFVSAWNTAERGGSGARDHLTFESYEQFHDLLSPQRLSLLRALRRQGTISAKSKTPCPSRWIFEGIVAVFTNDMLIAAQAVAADMILVTDNVGEFGRVTGLRIENWLRPDG